MTIGFVADGNKFWPTCCYVNVSESLKLLVGDFSWSRYGVVPIIPLNDEFNMEFFPRGEFVV